MRFQLNGSVEVSYRIPGQEPLFALTFDADEFSAIDSENGFTRADGDWVYRGLWDAVEENLQLRLLVVADRAGFREKVWEIIPAGAGLVDPAITRDRIGSEFLDE